MRLRTLSWLAIAVLIASVGYATACVGSDATPEGAADSGSSSSGATNDASSSSSSSSSGSGAEAGTDSGDERHEAGPDGPTSVAVSSIAIFRGYRTTGPEYQDHLYTAVSSDFTNESYTPELPNPYFYLAGEGGPGDILKPIYRCNDGQNPIHHWLDFNPLCNNHEGPLGFGTIDASLAARCGATTVVQLWHRPTFNDYIYTYNQTEADSLQSGGLYQHEGNFFAWNSSTIQCRP